MVKMLSFMLRIFYHNLNNVKKQMSCLVNLFFGKEDIFKSIQNLPTKYPKVTGKKTATYS